MKRSVIAYEQPCHVINGFVSFAKGMRITAFHLCVHFNMVYQRYLLIQIWSFCAGRKKSYGGVFAYIFATEHSEEYLHITQIIRR